MTVSVEKNNKISETSNKISETSKVEINVGSDIGYHTTKISFEIGGKQQCECFLSTSMEGVELFNPDALNVTYEKKHYVIGTTAGEPTENLNKVMDPMWEVLFFTAIAKVMPSNFAEVNVVTGVPADFYASQGKALYEKLNNCTVEMEISSGAAKLSGKKTIHIKKVFIFPQAAGIQFMPEYKDYFKGRMNAVIDIGGKTTDVAIFEQMALLERKTVPLGMLDVYKEIQDDLQGQGTQINKMFAYNIVSDRSMYDDATGKDKDMGKYLDDKFENFFKSKLYPELERKTTNLKLCRKIYVGGGAANMESAIKKIKSGEVCKDIYVNAKMFLLLVHAKLLK